MSWNISAFYDAFDEQVERVIGNHTYRIVCYRRGSYAVLEDEHVIVSGSLTNMKSAKKWVDINVGDGKTMYREPVERTGSSKEKGKTMFTVIHEGKRDFRIMFGTSFVSTHGTNAAATKRAATYNTELTEAREEGESGLDYLQKLQKKLS